MDLKQIEILSESKGIKIKELAEKVPIAFSGLYRSIKENSIKASTLERISQILDVPISIFFGIELEADSEVMEMKEKIINQQNYISGIENYLEQSKEFAKQQKDLIDLLIEERKRLNLFIEPILKISEENPELKNNPGVKEITKLLHDKPEHKAMIEEIYKDDPEGFKEYQNKVNEILDNT